MKKFNEIEKAALRKMFDRAIERGLKNPNNKTGYLYAFDECVQIALPKELSAYANAAAGNTNSIRVTVASPIRKLKEIFSSLESLEKFILMSECNSIENERENVRRRVKNMIINNPADSNFKYLCDKYNIPALSKKFGKENVIAARKFLTIGEFETRFGL